MVELALDFVIVCRCGMVVRTPTRETASQAYQLHLDPPKGGEPCPVRTEAWSGWALRVTAP